MQQAGFDRIASVYDGLGRLVFGDAIQHAQEYFLDDDPPQSKVLILGGGTGNFLVKLLALKPECEIWYVEASEKMLELSKVKTKNSDRVHFIQGTENSIPSGIQFDVIITNFYLDMFTDESLDLVLMKIQKETKPNVLWLATDFIDKKKWWQFILLKMMYRFFRTVCDIEATNLPDWNACLVKKGFLKKKSQFFFSGFIESTVYCHKSSDR